MDTSKLMPMLIAAGILYAGYKYGNAAVKTMALGAAGVIVAKNVPYLNAVV
jgi:hypothetical protein